MLYKEDENMRKLFSLLVVLCLLAGVGSALGEEAGGMQEVEIGKATFRVPAELKMTADSSTHWLLSIWDMNGLSVWMAEAEDYKVWILAQNYRQLEVDIDALAAEYNMDRNAVNRDYSRVFFDTAAQEMDEGVMGDATEEADYAMPDGSPILHANYSVAESYYARADGSRGWMVKALSDGGAVEAVKLQAICDNILLSIEMNTEMVVITADSGKVRSEASISGGLIKTAYKGETFEFIREEGDWYIVDVNGRTGYIHKGVAAIQ